MVLLNCVIFNPQDINPLLLEINHLINDALELGKTLGNVLEEFILDQRSVPEDVDQTLADLLVHLADVINC